MKGIYGFFLFDKYIFLFFVLNWWFVVFDESLGICKNFYDNNVLIVISIICICKF